MKSLEGEREGEGEGEGEGEEKGKFGDIFCHSLKEMTTIEKKKLKKI